jgi:signal transduction histidine kinase
MDSQLNRLTNLIGDLLDVTKINSGKIQFNKTRFNFNSAVQECVQDLQHTTHKHLLVMDFKEAGEVFTDKDRIGQVITNLISNAIKYSPQSDRIIISTELENNEVIVCVQDFGIGIAEDKKERVFEQFYRVSGSKQHTFPGLGLGLYISNEIIRREGGRMWVNSVEGKGSTFCFSLPAGNDAVTDNE